MLPIHPRCGSFNEFLHRVGNEFELETTTDSHRLPHLRVARRGRGMKLPNVDCCAIDSFGTELAVEVSLDTLYPKSQRNLLDFSVGG